MTLSKQVRAVAAKVESAIASERDKIGSVGHARAAKRVMARQADLVVLLRAADFIEQVETTEALA